MKVTRRDLDNSIIEKLDVLDGVIKTYDERHPDGFVSYGPNGFYFKKTNDTFLKKVYDENEIVSLEEALDSHSGNILSTRFTDFRSDNIAHSSTKSFMYNVPFIFSTSLGSKITHYKSFGSTVYTINLDGCLHRVDGKNEVVVLEILKILEANFNLAKKAYAGDIIDFDILDEDTVIVATNNFGVYRFTISKKEVELLFAADRVRKIKITQTGTLFVLTDDFCAQYDLATGNRIEKYMNIANRRQIPLDAIRVDGDIFVLGAPTGIVNLDNVLHLWKLDEAGISYNSADSKIEKFQLDNRYQIMFIAYDNKFIYLSGLFKDHPFILALDRLTLRVSYLKVFKELSLDEYTDFRAADGQFLVLSHDVLYILTKDGVEERMKLAEPCTRVKIINGEVIATTERSLVKFQLVKFISNSAVLSYDILKGDEPCNNIDILVKNAGRAERVTLIDLDTGREIPASYYMLYKGNAVIKLMNCKAKNIVMKLTVSPTSNIDGIVVRKNKMFLR